MAVRMRLRREGKKKAPFYRVVVADARSPRDGRYIEDIGYYQPLTDPSTIDIDADRALYWLRNGVQPSDQVKQLLRIAGIWETFKPGDPGRDRTHKIEERRQAAEERDRKVAEAEAAAAAELAARQAAEAAAAEPEDEPADAEQADAEPADADLEGAEAQVADGAAEPAGEEA
jgi:small subunit ribosomal protein S16